MGRRVRSKWRPAHSSDQQRPAAARSDSRPPTCLAIVGRYAAALTAAWPGRWLLFAWMRGVSDGATYVGAQSLPREIALRADGAVITKPVRELSALLRAPSAEAMGIRVTAGHAVTWTTATGGVPPQARLHVDVNSSGVALPASVGITLRNGAARHDAPPSLELYVEVSAHGACARLGREGCAPIEPPLRRSDGAWALAWEGTLWLDNGLVEAYVDGGLAVLSVFEPALVGAGRLSGEVWATGDQSATANVSLTWNRVASASFRPA